MANIIQSSGGELKMLFTSGVHDFEWNKNSNNSVVYINNKPPEDSVYIPTSLGKGNHSQTSLPSASTPTSESGC